MDIETAKNFLENLRFHRVVIDTVSKRLNPQDLSTEYAIHFAAQGYSKAKLILTVAK